MFRLKVIPVLFLVAFVFLSGCGGEKRVGEPAPFFEVKGIDGKVYKLSDYSGKKLLLVFWATWCPTCKSELSRIAKNFSRLRANGIEVLAICLSKDRNEIVKVAKEHGFEKLPIAMANNQIVMEYQDVRFLPTAFVIDKNGKIVSKMVGEIDPDRVINAFKSVK